MTNPKITILAAIFFTATALYGQPFKMVKEINTTTTFGSLSTPPNCVAGNTLFMAANDGLKGTELWKTDGTANGTVLVRDIQPGTGSSSPANMVQMGGILYFVANNGINGSELWKSDGTESGTVMVKDINPGSNGSSIVQLYVHNGVVYFPANDGTNGLELWKSDGTEAGTIMVRNINDGSANALSTSVNPYYFATLGSELYFAATNATSGRELWKTDGTANGTVMVKDLWLGSSGINNSKMIAWNGRVYFAATNGSTGIELWATNGTDAGTQLVKDISPGTGNASPNNLIVYNDTLFFSASNNNNNSPDLWKTDGTDAGTVMVRSLSTDGVTLTVGFNTSTNQFTVAGGKLYFASTGGPQGAELYVSDGTNAGTGLVKNINLNAGGSPVALTAYNNKLFFAALEQPNNPDLFSTDGTAGGTQNITAAYFPSGFRVASNSTMAIMGGNLYFNAAETATGTELWKSDGTASGTALLKEINMVRAGANNGNSLFSSDTLNGFYFFVAADDTNGNELWKSDGTEAGTTLVKDIFPGGGSSNPANFGRHGNYLYFSANDGVNGNELWRTDGTAEGTTMVANIFPGSEGSNPAGIASAGSHVYFIATHPDYGGELWRSDGTQAGTTIALDLTPGSTGGFSIVNDFVSVDGRAYFIAPSSKLFKAEGSTVAEFLPDIIRANDLGVVGNTLYIGGRNAASQTSLWKSVNGATPTVVKMIAPGSTNIYRLMGADGKLYFNGNNGTAGNEPWVSDGTEAGTFMLKDIVPGSSSSEPFQFVAGGGKVFFYARKSATAPADAELWATDGTSVGTYQVKDINPGTNSSNPAGMVSMPEGLVLFTANNGVNGTELWASDGTKTIQVQEFNSMGDGFNTLPLFLNYDQGFQFTRLKDGIIFFARSAEKGFQLYYGEGFQLYPGGVKPKRFYVNDNSTTGDVLTSAAGNDANDGSASAPWASLQYAYDVVAQGDSIFVDAGLYNTPDLLIHKPVTIMGPNHNISPNNSSDKLLPNSGRNAEAIISGSTFTVSSNNVSLEGLSFDPGAKSQIILSNTGFNNFSFKKNYAKITSGIFMQLSGPTIPNTEIPKFGNHLIDDNRFEKNGTSSGFGISVNYLNNVKVNNNVFVTPTPATQRALVNCWIGGSGIATNFMYTNNVSQASNYDMFTFYLASCIIEGNTSLHAQRPFFLQSVVPGSSDIRVSNNYLQTDFALASPLYYLCSEGNLPGSTAIVSIDSNIVIQNPAGRNTIPPACRVQMPGTAPNPVINIRGNQFTFNGDYGLFANDNLQALALFGRLKTVSVEKNEILFNGNNLTNTAPTNAPSATGVWISSDGGPNFLPADAVINIIQNKIDGFRNSVAVYDVIATAPNIYTGFGNLPGGVTMNINNNSFTGNLYAINNGDTSQVINGGCNWYGTTDGAMVASKVTGRTVRVNAYLTNGTDTDPSVGFQPGANGCASITGFSPTEGEAGKIVVIYGEGFTGATGAAFNGKPAQNISVTSDSTIVVTVPQGAVTGTVSVTKPSGTVVSAINFFVIPPPSADTAMVCPGSNGLLISDVKGSSYQWQVFENGNFVNIAAGSNYSGVQTDTLRLLNISTDWNGRTFRCLVNGATASKSSTLKVANYWTGSGGTTDWSNPLNWGCSGQVPDKNTNVIISSGSVILTEPASAKSIWVSPGASFTVQPGVIITINQQ